MKSEYIDKLWNICDELIKQCSKLQCMHCNNNIPKTNHNIHKHECYCQKCDDWNEIDDCRKKHIVEIFRINGSTYIINDLHNWILTDYAIGHNSNIIHLKDILIIKHQNITIFEKY